MKEKPFADPLPDPADCVPAIVVDPESGMATEAGDNIEAEVTDLAQATVAAVALETAETAETVPLEVERVDGCLPITLKAEHAKQLSLLFDKDYYCKQNDLTELTHENAWLHYLSVGAATNLSPNEDIELDYLKDTLSARLQRDIASDESIVELWLDNGLETISGAGWFDAEYYSEKYPDVVNAGQIPFVHYLTNGKRENRFANLESFELTQIPEKPEEPEKPKKPKKKKKFNKYQVTDPVTGEKQKHKLNKEHHKLLSSVFDEAFYCKENELGKLSRKKAWDHFMAKGLQGNLAINPAIENRYLKQALSRQLDRSVDDKEILLLLWLEHGTDSIQGAAWFDSKFYLKHYPDVVSAGANAFLHYANSGKNEGRMPNPYCLDLVNRSLTVNAENRIDLGKLIASVPERFRTTFMTGIHETEMLELFMPSLYQAQRENKDDVLPSLLFAHYLCCGWQDGHRPSVLWHEACYRLNVEQQLQHPNRLQPNYPIQGTKASVGSVRRHSIDWHGGLVEDMDSVKAQAKTQTSQNEQTQPTAIDLEAYSGETTAASMVFASKPETHNSVEDLTIGPGVNPYLHWFFTGRELNIIPSPLFDTELYCLNHPDILTAWKFYPFEHYLRQGLYEPRRASSTWFNGNHYLYTHEPEGESFPLLHYILKGQFSGLSPAAGVDCNYYNSDRPLRSSPVEETAMQVLRKIATLKEGVLADMVNRAVELEPMVLRPYGERRVRMAPVLHPEIELMHETRDIAAELTTTQYDTIVLVPHIRMAGSARIAGKLTQVLNSLDASGRVLVVTTDSKENERPDWFGKNAEIINISRFLDKSPQNRKVRALLDLLRGVKAKRIINLNSNLGWHLTSIYGRQISEWMDIYVYLFCWDRDIRNNKGGYPIQWFLPTFDYCKAVITDSENLRDELRDRYCLDESQHHRITTLHTPADDTDIQYNDVLKHRTTTNGVKRVFWSGRFDRQKRFDILIRIAQSMPDIEFWVWGKSVLADDALNLDAVPSNVKLMGVYTSIDDVPIASCDVFLYTSGWDGLPTVLIEVGSRGIPIVASAVGGVTDLINEKTGWPIGHIDHVPSYCTAINEILEDYPNALERAAKLRSHTLSRCDEVKFRDDAVKALGLDK